MGIVPSAQAANGKREHLPAGAPYFAPSVVVFVVLPCCICRLPKAINPLSEPVSEVSPVQLDTLETTGVSRPPSTYRNYCVSHCQAELTATREAYDMFDSVHHGKHTKSLSECRTGAWFARNQITGKVRVLSSSCKLRWCPMCSSTRRWFLTQEVSKWLTTAKKPKFLTLTLAHTTSPLDRQILHLYKCFQKYRKLNIMKRNVSGGIWFFQVKKNKAGDEWHPHLHCVIDAEYMSKFDLSASWAAVTITSNIIDIRTVYDQDKAAQEVARYASRAAMLEPLASVDRLELIEAMHGRRVVGTWGSARSLSLRPSKPADADDWKSVGSWSVVSIMAGQDDRADAIWKAFKTDGTIPEDCSLCKFELEFNGSQMPLEDWPAEPHQTFLDFY